MRGVPRAPADRSKEVAPMTDINPVSPRHRILALPRGPRLPGKPAEYGAQAYVHGPASTPVISVTTLRAADAAATLRLIADTIKFG